MLLQFTHFFASDKLATVYCGDSKDTVATLTNLSAELSDLSNQQANALADAIFVGMTAEEALEYDNRQARILEILRLLRAA
jgi:hypothetical protein